MGFWTIYGAFLFLWKNFSLQLVAFKDFAGSIELRGSTPALGDSQARMLPDAPPANTLKGKRERAILTTLLYHGLLREKLCRIQVKDLQQRSGMQHLCIHGKREKIRFLPMHPMAQRLIDEYLEAAGHRDDQKSPLFRPIALIFSQGSEQPVPPL